MTWCNWGGHSGEGKIERRHKSRTVMLLFVNRIHAAKLQFIAPLTGLMLRVSQGVKSTSPITCKLHSLHVSSFLNLGFALKKAVVYISKKKKKNSSVLAELVTTHFWKAELKTTTIPALHPCVELWWLVPAFRQHPHKPSPVHRIQQGRFLTWKVCSPNTSKKTNPIWGTFKQINKWKMDGTI